jgi:hypothetical protein
MHDLFSARFFSGTTDTYFAITFSRVVHKYARFALAGCYSILRVRCHWKCGARSCCRSLRAWHWSDGSRCCWTLLYDDYNPWIVGTAIVATGGVSVQFWPMLKTVGSSPVGICQHCAGEGHKNEEHLQSRERVIRCSYILCVVCVLSIS